MGAWCVVPGAVPGAWCRVLCRVPCAACRVLCWVSGCVPSRADGMKVAIATCMAARRFDELLAWQLANELKQRVYALVDASTARDDRKFCDQIKDSAASAPRNLAEGFACFRHPEFARYTRVAKASLVETQNHLRDGVDRGHWSPQQSRPLEDLADRAVGACVRLLAYLESDHRAAHRRR